MSPDGKSNNDMPNTCRDVRSEVDIP